MRAELEKKINASVRLLQSVAKTHTDIELAYSGGKDSDVILELAKMAGIPFTPIYKNTTIDPPGTINHVKKNRVQIVYPKRTFYQIIQAKGFPSRFARFCCQEIKEYKIKDSVILGIRREESTKRKKAYSEPVVCRMYKKKEGVNQILPILEWTLEDVSEFITERNIELAPRYYRDDGSVDFSRRLGCLGCPLKSDNGLSDFVEYPKMVRAWIKAGQIWWENHPNILCHRRYESLYEYFAFRLFYYKKVGMTIRNQSSLFKADWKQLLEDYFKIEL